MKTISVNIDQLSEVIGKYINVTYPESRFRWIMSDSKAYFIKRKDQYKLIYVGLESNVMYFDKELMVKVEKFFPVPEKDIIYCLKQYVMNRLNIKGIFSSSAGYLNQD
jgi:hypothetical protein